MKCCVAAGLTTPFVIEQYPVYAIIGALKFNMELHVEFHNIVALAKLCTYNFMQVCERTSNLLSDVMIILERGYL